MRKKAALHNLGCKVNAYELEAMQQMLEKEGYEIVPFEPGADVYVINTCTVTNIADRKSRQMLHRAKKMNPQAVVAAVGCYAQVKGEELKKDPAIDLVIGSNRKSELVRELERYFQTGEKMVDRSDWKTDRAYEEMEISRTEGHSRAFLKVQDGCDQFCTYCIIPYARGRVRSRGIPEVTAECRRLTDAGIRELVITGIHLCSYGKDLKDGTSLLDLLEAIHAIEGVERIRLGSLEPGTLTEDFIRRMAGMEKICPHFHLSLQSGCDRTLKRMNRRYDTAMFRKTCEDLRRYYEHPALTADIITGFPGETEEDFEACRAFTEEISFFETHVFPYSRREGTKAAVMPDQVTMQVKKERSSVLLELHRNKQKEFLQYYFGKPVEVLFEEQTEIDGIPYWIGHGREYQKVLLSSSENLTGEIRTVMPLRLRGDCLI